MRVVRPVIETGYENIIQIRLLLDGTDPQDMLNHWSDMLPKAMEKYKCDRGELVKVFGSTRDEWIKNDLKGWLAPNRFYPGTVEAVGRALSKPDTNQVYM